MHAARGKKRYLRSEPSVQTPRLSLAKAIVMLGFKITFIAIIRTSSAQSTLVTRSAADCIQDSSHCVQVSQRSRAAIPDRVL